MLRLIRSWVMALLIALGLTASICHSAEPKRILLVGQAPDGHPATTHEFMAGVKVIEALLKNQPGVAVTVANGTNPWPEGPELLKKADGVVLYVSEGAKWASADERRLSALVDLIGRKGGVLTLHWGIGCKDDKYIEAGKKLWGGVHGGSDRKYKFLETDLKPVAQEPLVKNLPAIKIKDEFYYNLKFASEGKLRPFMQAVIDDQPYTVAWGWERPDGGRSAGFSALHFHENWKQPVYRQLVVQSILWTNGIALPAGGVNVDLPDEVYVLKK